jgi:FAD/FMN-containing dehydrogenase
MSKKSEHKAAAASSSSLQNSNITLNLPASTNPTALKPELKTSNDNANNKTASRSKGVKSNEAATSHVVAKSDRKQFAHERWKFLKEVKLENNTFPPQKLGWLYLI